MDLSSLSNADLQALQKGDLSSVSVAGLRVIAGTKGGQSYDTDGAGNVIGKTGSPEAKSAQLPTSGMSAGDQFWAGVGKAPVDLGRGIKQVYGGLADAVDPRSQSRVDQYRKEVADSRALDAPLMNTAAGKWGYLTGNVAQMIPTAFIPGANTLAGAGAIGAASGLLQPSTSTGETLTNTGIGTALGPASILAGRAVGAVGKGVKAALWDPFTGPGQQRIAANVMQNFAGGTKEAQSAAAALQAMPSVLPGVQPTTAELAGNAGLAQLQKSLSSQPALMQDFAARSQGNRAAMVGAIGKIAGTPQELAAAQSARSAATAPMYAAAGGERVFGDPQLDALLQRPSMQSAWSRAAKLAGEHNDVVPTAPAPFAPSLSAPPAAPKPTEYSGKFLQYLKMGLNDVAQTADQKGMGAHEQNALNLTRGQFDGWLSNNVPALRSADQRFAQMSGPINQMQVGGKLADTLTPALSDFGQNTRLSANNFANSVRNGDQLTQRVTGMPLSLSDVLGKVHMDTIKKVGEQLARTANAAEMGAPKGSPTAQNLISQNVIQQFLGPLGMPNNMAGRIAQGAFGRTIGRPIQFLGNAAEPDVTGLLSRAALDPRIAQGLLTAAPQSQTLQKIGQELWRRQGLLGATALGAQRSLANPAQQ